MQQAPHMFVQIFSQTLFEKLLLKHEHVEPSAQEERVGFRPNRKEENTLQYVAGYIVSRLPRKVYHKEESEQMHSAIARMKEDAQKDTHLHHEWVWKPIM